MLLLWVPRPVRYTRDGLSLGERFGKFWWACVHQALYGVVNPNLSLTVIETHPAVELLVSCCSGIVGLFGTAEVDGLHRMLELVLIHFVEAFHLKLTESSFGVVIIRTN